MFNTQGRSAAVMRATTGCRSRRLTESEETMSAGPAAEPGQLREVDAAPFRRGAFPRSEVVDEAAAGFRERLGDAVGAGRGP